MVIRTSTPSHPPVMSTTGATAQNTRVLTLPTEPLVVLPAPSRSSIARTAELLEREEGKEALLPEEQQRDEEEYGWDRTSDSDNDLPDWTKEIYPTCNAVHELDPVGPVVVRQLPRIGRPKYRDWDGVTIARRISTHHPNSNNRWFSNVSASTDASHNLIRNAFNGSRPRGHYFASNPRMANLCLYCGGDSSWRKLDRM